MLCDVSAPISMIVGLSGILFPKPVQVSGMKFPIHRKAGRKEKVGR